jgi:hypothetical protein
MIHTHKKVKTMQGRVTSNDGQVAAITLPSTETLKILRYGSTQTEEYFLAQWAVGKDITVEGTR